MSLGPSLERKKANTSGPQSIPPVICIDKDEVPEMGNKESIQDFSQTEGMSSQDGNCSSPIMFPSQEPANEEQHIENEKSDNDVLEILDKDEHQDDNNKANTSTNSNSSNKVSKGKSRLSLGKKRSSCQHNVAASNENGEMTGSEPKQRRLISERGNEDLTIEENEEETDVSSKEKSITMQPILLKRPFNCNHKVCRTLEEADNMDLYFAPPGTDHSLYSKVISRKFESYRLKLRLAQSRRRCYHSFGDPIEPAPLITVRRSSLRVKRTSVVRNTQELKKRDSKANNDVWDVFEDLEQSKEVESPAKRVNEQVVLDEVPDSSKKQTAGTTASTFAAPKLDDVELTKDDDDVIIETVTERNLSSPLIRRRRPTPLMSKTVRPTSDNIQRAILEESSSDEDMPSFSFQKQERKSTASEANPTISEEATTNSEKRTTISEKEPTIPKEKRTILEVESIICDEKPIICNEEPMTSEKKPMKADEKPMTSEEKPTSCSEKTTTAREKQKHKSVIVSSNKNGTNHDANERTHPEPICHECPMCFKMFAEDRIEAHAANCEGLTTRTTRKNPLAKEESEANNLVIEKQWKEVYNYDKPDEEGQMSPVIKVRTPTKARELKLLAPNVTVRNLAREFSSQSKSGERFEMFGVNIVSSPKFSLSGDSDQGKRRVVSSKGDEKDAEKRKELPGSFATRKPVKQTGKVEEPIRAPEKKTPASKGQTRTSERQSRKQGRKVPSRRKGELELQTSNSKERVLVEQSEIAGKLSNFEKLEATIVDTDVKDGDQEVRRSPRRKRFIKSASDIGKGRRRLSDDPILKEDFIPLDGESKDSGNEKREDATKTPRKQLSSVTSISSSDDENDGKQCATIASKALHENDDMSALDFMTSGYKGHKRKAKNAPATRSKRPRKKLAPEDDESFEYCSFCYKYIPIESYRQHVTEELAQKKEEKGQEGSYISFTLLSSSNTPSTTTSKKDATPRSSYPRRRGNKDRNICLPDLAQATTSHANNESDPESPLRTYTPLDQCPNPNLDYYNQFSHSSKSAGQAGDSSRNRTKPFRGKKQTRFRKRK